MGANLWFLCFFHHPIKTGSCNTSLLKNAELPQKQLKTRAASTLCTFLHGHMAETKAAQSCPQCSASSRQTSAYILRTYVFILSHCRNNGYTFCYRPEFTLNAHARKLRFIQQTVYRLQRRSHEMSTHNFATRLRLAAHWRNHCHLFADAFFDG